MVSCSVSQRLLLHYRIIWKETVFRFRMLIVSNLNLGSIGMNEYVIRVFAVVLKFDNFFNTYKM